MKVVDRNLVITKAVRKLMNDCNASMIYTNKYRTMRSVKTYRNRWFDEIAFLTELPKLMKSLNVDDSQYEVRRFAMEYSRPSFIVRVKYTA